MAAARGGFQGGGGHFGARVRREPSFCPAHKSRSFTPPSFHDGRSFRQRSFALHNTPRFNAVRNARAAMGTTAAVGASALVARHVNVTRNTNAVQRSRPCTGGFSFHLWHCAYEAAGRPATQSSQSFHPHGTANRESAGRLLCQALPTIQRFHGPTSPRDWSRVVRSEAGSTQSSHVATG